MEIKTDVLFIVPSFSYKSFDNIAAICPNAGTAILASILEEQGYHIKIVDNFALNLTEEEIIKYVKSVNPKVVAVTSATANNSIAKSIIAAVKKFNSEIVTIYGGPHVTIMPDKVLESGVVDYVVLGEAEETIIELFNYLFKNEGKKSNIKGIGYLDEKNKAIITEKRDFIKEIDQLPFPAYHLLPMNSYKPYGWLDFGRKFCSMVTSRGCPYRCTYCSSSNIFGYRWRSRSAGKVFEEIKLLYDKFGITHIAFQDDEFTVNHQRTIDICNMIIENKLDLVWECATRVSNVNDELIKKMSEAGCKGVLYGIECGYQEGIDKINKKITLEQAMAAVKWAKKYKISTKCAFMMGFPWESEEEIKKTIKFAKKLNADITFFNILNPYPGTPLYNEIKESNLFVEGYTWDQAAIHGGHKPTINTKYLMAEDLAYWSGRAYLSIYTNPKYLLRRLRMMSNWIEFKRNIKSATSLFSVALRKVIIKG